MSTELERTIRQFLFSVFLLFFFRIFQTFDAIVSRYILSITTPFFGIAHSISNRARLASRTIKMFKNYKHQILVMSQENMVLLQENAELKRDLADIKKLDLARQVSLTKVGYYYLNAKVLYYSSQSYGLVIAALIDENDNGVDIHLGAIVSNNNHLVGKVVKIFPGKPRILKIQLASNSSFSVPAKSMDQKHYLLRGHRANDGRMVIDHNQLFQDHYLPGEILFVANTSDMHLPEIPIGVVGIAEPNIPIVEPFEHLEQLEYLQIILPKNKINPQ